jgi:hypothetical protein
VKPVPLIAICEATHAAHDAEHVVVDGVDTDLGGEHGTNGVVGERELEGRIVDTGEVAGAAGLVLLGLEGEGVHVDANRGDVGVVLVRLDQVEVLALTLGEAIVAVELDLGRHDRVGAGHALDTGHGVAGLEDGAVEPVGVVEGLGALVGADDALVAGHERIALDNPNQLLGGVVEVQLDLVGGAGDRLAAGELELLDQVLVGDLGEAAALIRVEVDVVDIQGGRDQAGGGDAAGDGVAGGVVEDQVLELVELEPDLDLVVLEGNQGEGEARVAVEPELEGDVQGVLRGAVADLGGGAGLDVGGAVLVAALTALDEEVDELGHVANHLGVARLLTGLLGELVPDLEPVAVVLVDLLTANLDVDVVDQVVADPVEPAELGTAAVARLEGDGGEGGLEVDTVDQIAVTGDRALDLLAEVGRAVEGLLNRLHGEVGVATVNHLEEGDLRVSRQVDVLCAIGNELH